MKIAIINDTHAGVKNGTDIFLDYQERFYAEVFFPYLKEHGIKQIIHLGDFYDNRRVINFKVINCIRRMFLDQLREHKITMDIIPGNHDTVYKSTNDLCSLKELLGHYTDCVNIHMDPTVIDYDGLDIALLPWVAPDIKEDCDEFIQTCKAPILMGHLELAGFKFMANSNVVSHGDVASGFSRFESVYSGHYHTKSERGNITYLGSQMEFTWADCEDPKFFHVLDTETRDVLPVRNPLTIFKKLYYKDTKFDTIKQEDIEGQYVKVIVLSKKDLYEFDKYLDRIHSLNPLSVSIVENFDDILDGVDDDEKYALEDPQTLIDNYIDAIDCDHDKNILKRMMHQVYVEALDVDAI